MTITETPAAAAAAARLKPMSLVDRTRLMQAVAAADPTIPDAWLAEEMSESFGRPITAATIASYRASQGIASVPAPSGAELRRMVATLGAEVQQLRAEIAALKQLQADEAEVH